MTSKLLGKSSRISTVRFYSTAREVKNLDSVFQSTKLKQLGSNSSAAAHPAGTPKALYLPSAAGLCHVSLAAVRLPQLCAPGPGRGRAQPVFPAGMYTHTELHRPCVHACGQPHAAADALMQEQRGPLYTAPQPAKDVKTGISKEGKTHCAEKQQGRGMYQPESSLCVADPFYFSIFASFLFSKSPTPLAVLPLTSPLTIPSVLCNHNALPLHVPLLLFWVQWTTQLKG